MLTAIREWRRRRREERQLVELNRGEPGGYDEPRSARLVGMILGRDRGGSRPPF